MQGYHAIRSLKADTTFKKGDVLVLFGELFSRGYATGLVEEAERRGMKVIRATVGRRDKDNQLRALNAEELAQQPQPIINIPLEAGFDLEPDSNGKSPVDYMKEAKLADWESFHFPPNSLKESRDKGRARFLKNVRAYLTELEKLIPAGSNVLFAHLMAGGIPRTKIIMPLMNWALRGTGDKYLSSEKLWDSGLGEFCKMSFSEVTADTYSQLIDETTALRERLQKNGSKVAYTAYGYHGTEILIRDQYQWQSYTPYIQGFAKKRLEEHSRKHFAAGVSCAVYNCPEILTNSSAVFNGVEVSLYPMLGALAKEGNGNEKSKAYIESCLTLLKSDTTLKSLTDYLNDYMTAPVIKENCHQFEKWPQHNSREQLERMLETSAHLHELHKDPKTVMTAVLSELVLEACGRIMIADAGTPEAPVSWINHDVISKIHVT